MALFAICIAGTNTLMGVLDFDPATDESAQGSFMLPGDWDAGQPIDLEVEAFANEASANVARLSIQTACVGAGEAFDSSYNAAQTFTWTGTGAANQRAIASQAALTVTGCAAGERMMFKFLRDADATSGTDSLAVDFRLVSLRFKLRKLN